MTRAAIALALVFSMVATIGPVGASDMHTIDHNHGLATDTAINQYEQEGVVATNYSQFDLRMTIAEDHEDAGIERWMVDATKQYLRLEYDEEISRSIRIYLPADYWYPYEDADLEIRGDDVTAELYPGENDAYSVLEVTFSGQTDATLVINRQASFVFRQQERYRDALNMSFGVEVPRIGGERTQWEYVDGAALAGENSTHALEDTTDNMTIQYNDGGDVEDRWLEVPECGIKETAVCTFEKDGVDKTYLMSTQSDPPEVRYASDVSMTERSKSYTRDLGAIPDRILSDLRGLFGDEKPEGAA